MTGPRSWQRCDDCGHELEERDAAPQCPECGGLLAIRHAWGPPTSAEQLRARLALNRSPSGVWRFGELVLPTAIDVAVSHPEGNTPLLERRAINAWCGLQRVLLKHEGQNPTGSFKDRGMTVAMTHARRLGVPAVACASTGNTSASMAAYAAHAGIPAFAVVPDGQVSTGKLAQTLAYGARTVLVDGDFDACLRLLRKAGAELGMYLVNSVNPFRIEGQKTVVFELLQQLEWQVPDWIVLPAGNLGNTAAVGKAIGEALDLGLIPRRPRIAAVQAAGAAPFAAAYDRGFDRLDTVPAQTVASAIKIGAPASYHRAAKAIRDNSGVVVAVTDDEILASKVAIDRAGIGCEPASAVSVAGIRKLQAQGIIRSDELVVAILTGHILKDPGVLEAIHGDDSIAPALANRPVRISADIRALAEELDRRHAATATDPPLAVDTIPHHVVVS